MDTRFWGPSGWKLLHTISFTYNPTEQNKIIYKNFLETLPFILPCKFCRSSLTDYYRELPYSDEVLSYKNNLIKWMYDIHNKVNDKLRKQGLNPTQDPSLSAIKELYSKWLNTIDDNKLLTFWDFLFSIAYNHPKETTYQSKPMPNCPTDISLCKDICEKNKWNVLGKRDRLYWYKRFWDFLPAVLPEPIRNKWLDIQKDNPSQLTCRRSTIAWLWRMRCALDDDFKDPYTLVCKKIASHASGCSKSLRAKTCRKQSKLRKLYNSTQKTLKK